MVSCENVVTGKAWYIGSLSNTHNNYYSVSWKYVTNEDEEVLQSADHPNLWNSKPRDISHVKRDLALIGRGVQSTQQKKNHRNQQKESVYRPLNYQR